MDQWLDKVAAECRKLASLVRIQNCRCGFSAEIAIWNDHIIVRSL
jgi:hypothetical protein